MSSDEVWYFLRGQEAVGPFSKAILQQIHGAGQLSPETLVWRDGMENWQPASAVVELEIPPPVVTPKPIPPPVAKTVKLPPPISPSPKSAHTHIPTVATTATPGAERPKLKLKPKESAIVKPEAKLTQTGSVPLLHSPVRSPHHDITEAVIKEASKAIENKDNPSKSKNQKKEVSFLKNLFDQVFSSLVMTPLFLIACGSMIFLFSQQFPNIFWFRWLAIGFATLGILSLVGFHFLDGFLRVLAFLFFLPPLMLFWPVIMSEVPWQTVSISHWIFAIFCVLYGLTTRIGFSQYFTPTAQKFAVSAGLIIVLFIASVAQSVWTPPQWKELIEQESESRLPASLAAIIGKPEWATIVGTLYLNLGESTIEQKITLATLKQIDSKEFQFVMKTTDNLYFGTKIVLQDSSFNPEKLLGQDYPLSLSKEAANDPTTGETNQVITVKNQKINVTSATLHIGSVENKLWQGAISFQLAPGKDYSEANLSATFKAKVSTLK